MKRYDDIDLAKVYNAIKCYYESCKDKTKARKIKQVDLNDKELELFKKYIEIFEGDIKNLKDLKAISEDIETEPKKIKRPAALKKTDLKKRPNHKSFETHLPHKRSKDYCQHFSKVFQDLVVASESANASIAGVKGAMSRTVNCYAAAVIDEDVFANFKKREQAQAEGMVRIGFFADLNRLYNNTKDVAKAKKEFKEKYTNEYLMQELKEDELEDAIDLLIKARAAQSIVSYLSNTDLLTDDIVDIFNEIELKADIKEDEFLYDLFRLTKTEAQRSLCGQNNPERTYRIITSMSKEEIEDRFSLYLLSAGEPLADARAKYNLVDFTGMRGGSIFRRQEGSYFGILTYEDDLALIALYRGEFRDADEYSEEELEFIRNTAMGRYTMSQIRMILSVAKRNKAFNGNVSEEDRFQNAMASGKDLAADTFKTIFERYDISSGNRLTTLAAQYYRASITRENINQQNTIVIPSHIYEARSTLSRFVAELDPSIHRTPEELYELFVEDRKRNGLKTISKENFYYALGIADPMSLDAPYYDSEGEETTMLDYIDNSNNFSVDEEKTLKFDLDILRDTLDRIFEPYDDAEYLKESLYVVFSLDLSKYFDQLDSSDVTLHDLMMEDTGLERREINEYSRKALEILKHNKGKLIASGFDMSLLAV